MACARCRRATGCPIRLGGAGQGFVASAVSLMASWNRSALLTKDDDVASTTRAVMPRLPHGCGGRSVVGLLFAQPMNGGVAVGMRNASMAEIRLRPRGVSEGACAGGGDEDNERGTWVGLARYVVVRQR